MAARCLREGCKMEKAAVKAQASNNDAIGALIQSLDKSDWTTTVARAAQSAPPAEKVTLSNAVPKGEADRSLPSVVIVDQSAHKTHVLQLKNGQIEDVLTVSNAVGKSATPTPFQRWEVSDKRLDPIWYPPKSIGGKPVAPFKENPRNPIGLAFIRLDGTNFGLHGTNRPDQIGRSVSHGCMRHNNTDILKIYPLVDKGTAVYTVPKFEGTKISMDDFRKKR